VDLSDTPEEARFRQDLRTWLQKSLAELPWPEPADLVERAPFWRRWQAMLFEAGYAGLTWPREYGGQGLDERMRAIFGQECDRAGAPERLNTIGEDFAGPTIARFGSEAQKQRFLRPILTGEEIWCQLFSEPESGSDLASLRTKATRVKGEGPGETGGGDPPCAEGVDGGWRIQGQKVWTSRAQLAAHAILLARTAGGPRHKGITYFLLPMDSEGVTVRPLAHMLGEAEFNEVFLDDVFLPDDAVVGEVDGGWPVAMGTLAFERVAIATGRVNTTRAVDDIIADVRGMTDPAGNPLGADPHVRQKIADLWARALVHYTISQRVISGAAAGEPPGPAASIGKLYFCPLVEDLADFRLSLEPLAGQFGLDDTSQDAARARRWLRLANQARGTAIAGGSTFIQRNIVAERVLGMPR
jgi:alkylation response protein AidB-like acyl-CoA dehydrogenase